MTVDNGSTLNSAGGSRVVSQMLREMLSGRLAMRTRFVTYWFMTRMAQRTRACSWTRCVDWSAEAGVT